jgi:hypothetical protein
MKLMKAYIQQMKVENPEEYEKLVKEYGSELEMVDHIEELTHKAVKYVKMEDKT